MMLALALVAVNGASAAAGVPLELSCAGPTSYAEHVIAFTPQTHAATVVLHDAPDALVEIEERDLEISIAVAGAPSVLDSEAPPRFGRGYFALDGAGLSLQLNRQVASNARGGVVVRLHCAPSAPIKSAATWFAELRSITAAAAIMPLPVEAANTMLENLSMLDERAPDTWTRALATHWRAQALLLSGQTARASSAFEEAGRNWRSVGDLQRAAAADVAYVEDLQRLGRSQEVLTYITHAVTGDQQSYYPARLMHAACLAQRYLAQYTEADACFRRALEAFSAMDEAGEMVSVVSNYAQLKHLRGEDAEAESMIARAFEQITGPDAAMLRGRVLFLRADLAQSRAEIPEALALLDAALGEFGKAGLPRWEGNVLLRVSTLQRSLLAFPEAYAAVTQAFTKFSPEDAPARVASALVALARIDEVNDRGQFARHWLRLAAQIFNEQGMSLERDGVQASLASIALNENDLDTATLLIDSADSAITYYADRWALVRARAQSLVGNHQSARATLAIAAGKPATLEDRIQIALAQSRLATRAGDALEAEAVLLRLHRLIEQTALSSRSPLLRYLVGRRLDQVEGEMLALQLPQQATREQILPQNVADQVWPTLRRRTALMDLRSASAASFVTAGNSLDRAITADLLGAPIASSPATSDLLKLLAQGRKDVKSTDARATSLAEFSSRLPEGALFLTHVDAGDRGILLLLGRNLQHIALTESRAIVLALSSKLRGGLANPSTPTAELDVGALALGQAIFSDLPATSVPRRLYVDRDSILAGIPWPVMHWPGQRQTLADSTLMTISALKSDARDPRPRADHIDLIIASQSSRLTTGTLDALPNASAEAAAIRGVALSHDVAVNVFLSPRRDDVLASLATPRRILHVAAHGLADSSRIGHSGIWLSEEGGAADKGEFVGWSEPVMRGVQAQLVVLNACSLASRKDAADASMSFATALSRAGAEDVIAALWSTSDAASGIWVPVFYSELLRDDSNDPALALAAAVDALRRSRMFRHPFYWASLVHVQSGS